MKYLIPAALAATLIIILSIIYVLLNMKEPERIPTKLEELVQIDFYQTNRS